jgi:hypothetical protein
MKKERKGKEKEYTPLKDPSGNNPGLNANTNPSAMAALGTSTNTFGKFWEYKLNVSANPSLQVTTRNCRCTLRALERKVFCTSPSIPVSPRREGGSW